MFGLEGILKPYLKPKQEGSIHSIPREQKDHLDTPRPRWWRQYERLVMRRMLSTLLLYLLQPGGLSPRRLLWSWGCQSHHRTCPQVKKASPRRRSACCALCRWPRGPAAPAGPLRGPRWWPCVLFESHRVLPSIGTGRERSEWVLGIRVP